MREFHGFKLGFWQLPLAVEIGFQTSAKSKQAKYRNGGVSHRHE